MGVQVGKTFFQCGHVRVFQVRQGGASVHFQGARRGYDDDGGRVQSGLAALDVQEFFRAQVKGEPGFRDGIVPKVEGHFGGQHGVAAVGDVGERASVQEAGHPFHGLDQVGHQGVFQQGHDGAGDAEFPGEYGLVVRRETDHDAVDAVFHVLVGGSEAKARHDFRSRSDVETRFTREALLVESHDDGAQGAVIHVHDALPRDFAFVNVQRVEEHGVVNDGADQVVGGRDGMEVSREVHVDFIRRRQGAFTAAGGTALAAEYRAHGGLPKRQAGFFTDGLQPLRQTDGDGGFPFSGRGGRDGGNQNEFAGCGRLVQYVQGNLGLVAAEGDHVVFIDAQLVDTIGECRCDHECMMTEAPSFCKKVHGHSCGGNGDVFNHHGSGPREILGSRRVQAEGARERENWAVRAPLFFKPWERVLPLCFLMKAFRE